ncbi:MAG: MFS transporter [Caulobacteraceae bacterium]
MTAEPMDAATPAKPVAAHAGFKVGGAYAWYVLAVATVICAFSLFDRQVLSIVAVPLQADLHLSNTDLGTVFGAVFAIFYALFGIPLGKLADGWNRSWLLAIAIAGWSLSTMLGGLATGFVVLALARSGVAVGEALANPSAYSLLSDWFPKKQRATAIAIYSAGIAFGLGGSFWVGGKLLDAWRGRYPTGVGPFGLHDWQAVFLGIGAPGLLIALWAATLREPPRGLSDGVIQPNAPHPVKAAVGELFAVLPLTCQWRLWRMGAKPREIGLSLTALLLIVLAVIGMTHLSEGFAAKPPPPLFRLGALPVTSHGLEWATIGLGVAVILGWVQSLKQADRPTYKLLWANPQMIAMTVASALYMTQTYGLTTWSAKYAITHFHASPGEVGAKLGLVTGGVGLVATLFGGWLADFALRFSPRGRLYVSFGAMIAVVPMAYLTFAATSLDQFLWSYTLLSFSTVMWLPGVAATGQELVMPRMRGAAAASYNLATGMFGLGLGPFLVGLISDKTGSLSTGILSIYWLSPLVWIAMFILVRGLPKAEATRLDRARAAGEAV